MVSLIEFSSRENLAVRLASAILSNLSVFHCERLRGVRRDDVANDLLCLEKKSLILKRAKKAFMNLIFLINRHANKASRCFFVFMLIANNCNKCYRVIYLL